MPSVRIELLAQLRRYQALRLGKLDAARSTELDHRIGQLRTALIALDGTARDALTQTILTRIAETRFD